MKNQPVPLVLLLLSLLFSACGNKESTAPVSPAIPSGKVVDLPGPGASVPLPAPQDLLACPGYLSIADVRGDAQMGAVRLLSSEPVAVLVDFYAANLAADGWTLNASVAQKEAQHLQFGQNGRLLRLQISPAAEAGGSSVQIAWKQPAEATEFADAHSPDLEEEGPESGSQGSVEW